MSNQYDYNRRFDELTKGIDTTFKNDIKNSLYSCIYT